MNINDICELSENDYCERHKIRHIGRTLELSQLRNVDGWQFRQQADQALMIKPDVIKPSVKETRQQTLYSSVVKLPSQRIKPCNCGKEGLRDVR